MTTDLDRALFLRMAREAITAHVTRIYNPESAIRSPQSAILERAGAAFVSLHAHGHLRGCIGHIQANEELGIVVPRCAVSACSSDPRFPPITSAELDDMEIEISLLGPFEPISSAAEVEIGRHGLFVEQGWHRGLLLPQVATEWKWDAEAFLAQTCQKAGLPRDAWKTGAALFRFEAEVFAEPGKSGASGRSGG
jgi:AmmeMemoRadiSam system protein A